MNQSCDEPLPKLNNDTALIAKKMIIPFLTFLVMGKISESSSISAEINRQQQSGRVFKIAKKGLRKW